MRSQYFGDVPWAGHAGRLRVHNRADGVQLACGQLPSARRVRALMLSLDALEKAESGQGVSRIHRNDEWRNRGADTPRAVHNAG